MAIDVYFSGCVCPAHEAIAEDTLNFLSTAHQSAPCSAAGPALYTSPSPTHSASTAGFSVTVLPAITSFFSSLSPSYVPEGGLRQLVASTTANAGETAVKKAGQHDTDAVLDKVKLACTIASCWVPTARVVTEAVATICSSFALAQSLGSVLERKDGEQQSSEKKSSAPHPDCTNAAAATLLTLVALDNLAPAAAVPAPYERGSPEQPIEVSNSTTLSKIGQPDYPTDAYYLQTQSFSHNHTEPGPAFQGHYQGGCHTISDLKTCLFSKLDRYGVVRDLHLTNATIDSDVRRLGAVACEMAPFSSVRDMHIEHITITNRAKQTRRETLATGVVVGHQHRAATISGMTIDNCLVNTTAYNSPAGIIGGEINGLARDINITDCRIVTLAGRSDGGIGAALLHGELDGLTVVRGEVRTDGDFADAAIGASDISGGRLRRFAASHCQARTHGQRANAGIGVGSALGDLGQLAIVDCLAETNGDDSFAGIGAGQLGSTSLVRQGRLKDMTSVDNRAITRGSRAWAGIGAGWLTGEADNIVAFNSSVKTEHSSSPAAIGAGFLLGQLKRLTAVNCTVENLAGDPAKLEVGQRSSGGSDVNGTRSLNNKVNGDPVEDEPQVPEPLCTAADPRLLTDDCQVIQSPLVTMGRNCSSEPLDPAHGSVWRPIEVNDTSTVNNIGLNNSFPSSAHYVQTTDLNGTALHGNESLVFNGHYDGRNHSIEGLQTCLFNHLQGTVKNLRLSNANISGNGQPAAVIACTVSDAGGIEHVHLSDCHVTNRGSAGVISGERIDWFNRVAGAVVHNSTLETSGPDAPAGMIAGKCHGDTKAVDIHSSRVVTHGQGSHAGLGCGTSDSWVDQMVSTCSEVETHGNDAFAGIGVGKSNYGGIGPLTSVNSSVATSGARSPAGIGAGQAASGWLEEIDAVHSRAATTGAKSSSGVGAGALDALSSARNVTAVHCDVITEGDKADAGICSGDKVHLQSLETNCTSVNSSASALGENSGAYFARTERVEIWGNKALNTRLNGRLFDTGDVGNLSTLCSTADSRFIKPDCQATLARSCPMPQSFYLPPLPPATPLAAAGLGAGAIAGIIAGGVIVLLGAGYCYYRHRSTGGQGQERGADPS